MPALAWGPSCERLFQEMLLLLILRCNRRDSGQYRPRDFYYKKILFERNEVLVVSERAETEQLHAVNVQDSKVLSGWPKRNI